MLYLWILLLVVVAGFERLRAQRLALLVQHHQFRLFALRDDLREAVIRGDISPKNWVFGIS